MRAALYVRQSLDKQGLELGIERQEAECRRLADARGYTVTEVIRDNNRSASVGERPGYQRLLGMIEHRTIDVVIVLRIDRLLRRPIELEWLIDLCERTGASVVSVDGLVDLTNSGGRQVARLQAAFARWEVEVKSERHRLANAQKAAAGKPHGSRRPYGYEADLVTIRADEAETLRQMAYKVIHGWSLKDVAYDLNARGVTTTTGKPWYPITVRNLLQKKRYAGVREYQGAEYPAVWPAVFDTATWKTLQLTLSQRREARAETPAARRYLLTGLVVCGKCGRPMNGSARIDRPGAPLRRTYICSVQGDTQRKGGCGGVRRNADALDWWIREAAIQRLDTPQLAALLPHEEHDDTELFGLIEERLAQQQRLDGLAEDYSTGLLSRDQLARANTAGQAHLAALNQRIEELHRARQSVNILPAGQTVRQAWEECGSDSWRRSLLQLLIEKIIVHPGNTKPFINVDGRNMRFDPSLIEVLWRH